MLHLLEYYLIKDSIKTPFTGTKLKYLQWVASDAKITLKNTHVNLLCF